jgi:ribosomal protein S18 acetylase RimI-like enzyme
MLNAPTDERDFKRLLTLAGLHFRQRHLGWTFWLCEDLLPQRERKHAPTVFRDSRMDCIAQPPGMYAASLAPPTRPLPRLEIRRVLDGATRTDFAHLSSVIFSLGFQTSRDVYASAELWDGCMAGWVGYWEGTPVSVTAVVVAAGVAGVYSVGTLPAFQGRGCAETMMRHGLSWARDAKGVEATVLQATAQGFRLYKKLGYRVVTQFGVYLKEGNGFH